MALRPKFLTYVDKRPALAIALLLIIFGLVIAVLIFGRFVLNLGEGEFQTWFDSFVHSPWAPIVVILTYIGVAFLGAPQWALFAATIAAFGPTNGFIYSWVATLISASFDFWLGRKLGAERLQQFGGALVHRIATVVKRNGFVTSFAVRLVPTGPFILVNMAAGVAKMRFVSFLAGTALGIIPKILIVSLFAQGIISGVAGEKLMFGFIILALLFVGIMLLAKQKLKAIVPLVDESEEKHSE